MNSWAIIFILYLAMGIIMAMIYIKHAPGSSNISLKNRLIFVSMYALGWPVILFTTGG